MERNETIVRMINLAVRPDVESVNNPELYREYQIERQYLGGSFPDICDEIYINLKKNLGTGLWWQI